VQSVFLALAQQAPALRHHPALSGWLHTTAVYTAAKLARAEHRRRARERDAYAMQELTDAHPADTAAHWNRVAPLLDDALQHLNAGDREVVLLRFFSAHGYAAIGATLRISENTARMRVQRALEKLRRVLESRGVVSTAAALGTALTSHAATAGAAPPFLAAAVTASALAGSTSAGVATTLLNFMALTKVQLTLAAAVLVTGGTTLSWQYHQQRTLEREAARAPATAVTLMQVQADILALEQTAADVRTLQARAAQLARVQAELADLRERRQVLENRAHARASAHARAGAADESRALAEKVGTIDAFPQIQHRVAVQYPEALRQAGIPGEVMMSFVVDANGAVQDPKVVETTHPDLVEPALASIAQWRFTSGRKGGKNVNVRVEMPVEFRPEDSNWF
jgi:RNA polymerase sigma factor (sigma-70 family)